MKLSKLNLYNTERTTGKKFGVAALVGLMLIPAILAASFQWAQADASDHLDRLEAAVVNNDQPVTIKGQYVPIGRLLLMRLTDSQLPVNVHWTLTDEKDAAEGLTSGRFAAVVTIPKTFSANATSVSLMDPKKLRRAVIDVQTSKSAGVVDPAIAQALSVSITDSLNTQLAQRYVANIFVQFRTMKKQLGKAAWGAGKLGGGLDQLYDGSLDLVKGLARLAWGTDKVADGNEQLADGLELMHQKTKGLPAATQQLADGGHALNDGLGALNDNVQSYSGQIKHVLELVREINSKTGAEQKQLAAALDQLDALDQQLATAVDACQPALVKDTPQCQGVLGAHALVQQVRDNLALDSSADLAKTLLVSAKDLDYYANQVDALVQGVNRLAWGSGKLAQGLDQLNAGMPKLVDGIAQAAAGSRKLADGSRRVADGAATAADRVNAMPGGIDRLRDGAYKLHDGLADGADKVPGFDNQQSRDMSAAMAAPVTPQALRMPDADLSAGYFTALALAVAALVVFMLIRAVPARAMNSNHNAFKLALQAYAPAVAIAVLQTVMVAIALEFSLHLSPLKLLAFSAVVFLAAAAMLAVSQALVAALGGAGRFVALFAIAVSAPTALISAMPQALQTLVSLTPIAPTIDALRGVITGASIASDVTALLVWGLAGLVVTLISITKERQVSVRALAQLA